MDTSAYDLSIVHAGNPMRALVVFPACHTGFQGHFPAEPILPGFLHVQVILDCLKAASVDHHLLEVTSAKFVRPIAPGEQVQVEIQSSSDNAFDAVLSVDATTCSRISLLTQPA